MTQEDKDLLLKDLCARIPYKVKYMDVLNPDEQPSILQSIDESGLVMARDGFSFDIVNIKPYLFPLSNMTEEQIEELESLMEVVIIPRFGEVLSPTPKYYDWLNKNNFDYRGLIPMGLATNATGLNIYLEM